MLQLAQNHNHQNRMNPSDEINKPVPGRLSCDSCVSYDISDYGNRVRKSAGYYAKFRQSWSGPLIATVADDDEDEEGEFGFSTPPVWGPTSPTASPLPPNRNNNHYRNLSPASKAQAIARGQRELMELASKMPESCYELSLKDLVEKQPIVDEKLQEQESQKVVKKKKNDKKMEIVKKMRSGSVSHNNEGFLLKMVFPVVFGMKKDKKKKKNYEVGSYSFKVAPRPPVVEGSDHKSVDKEWWKKRFEQSQSESSTISSSNNGSGKSTVSSNSCSSLSRNSSRHETSGGCLSFSFMRNKKKQNVQ